MAGPMPPNDVLTEYMMRGVSLGDAVSDWRMRQHSGSGQDMAAMVPEAVIAEASRFLDLGLDCNVSHDGFREALAVVFARLHERLWTIAPGLPTRPDAEITRD